VLENDHAIRNTAGSLSEKAGDKLPDGTFSVEEQRGMNMPKLF
jgi:hypothetical protein